MALRRLSAGLFAQVEYTVVSCRFLAAARGPISDAGSSNNAPAQFTAFHTSSRELQGGQIPHSYQQRRGLKLFEVFSKEAKAERRKKLNEDLQRGYWDDFKQLKDEGGKMFQASDRLTASNAAPAFPSFQAVQPNGSALPFPEADGSVAAGLVCIAFRAGAEEIIGSWRSPFEGSVGSQSGVVVYELSLVESLVMSIWPFRSMILRAAQTSAAGQGTNAASGGASLPHKYLFSFGDSEWLRQPLGMTNRLTGYVYLIDGEGRVRWRGSGKAEPAEIESLLRCTQQLLKEKSVPENGTPSEQQHADV